MIRIVCFISLVVPVAGVASADQYWIAYEGNDFPENEGWERYATDPPAQRWLEDGSLFIDSRGDTDITETYSMYPEAGLDPEVGETFVMAWRLNVKESHLWDAGVYVSSDDLWSVHFSLDEQCLISGWEPAVHVPFKPGIFHDFELRSDDMRFYELWLDGSLVLEGRFFQSFFGPYVGWGDTGVGPTSLVAWDYFRFGVVPEPGAWLLCLIALSLTGQRGAILVNRARWSRVSPCVRTRDRRSNSMRSVVVGTVLAALTAFPAVGRNVINEHSGYYQQGVHYSIRQENGNDVGVEIHKNSVWAQIWKFEAYDSQTGEPGYINYIRIQPTGTVGYIRLRIVGAPGHQYGARDVKKIDLLTNADNTTEVLSVNISGDFGELGPMLADSVGSLLIGGDVLNSIAPEGSISEYAWIGGHLRGNITADSVGGYITASGTGVHTGNITIGSSYSQNITIHGTYAGNISIARSMSGNVFIGEDLRPGASVKIGTTGTGYDMSGNITILDELAGLVKLGRFHYGQTSIGTLSEDGEMDVVQHVYGQTTIGTLAGDFKVSGGGLLAPLHVTGDVTGHGVIFVKGSCTAPIDIDGNFAGSLSIGWQEDHDLRAALTIDGACSGDITITRLYSDASSQGSINIGQNCTGDISIGNYMNGPVNIGGSLAGTLAVGATWGGGNIQQNVSIGGDLSGHITANGTLSAEIQINGSLINGPSAYDIELAGMDPNTAAVAVDWDGFDLADEWKPGAIVRVAGVNYTGNDPDHHIWEITCEKGDMNNDGYADGFDIQPFTMALTDYDPGSDYDLAFPGLLGSVTYHADCNCDDVIDGFDVQPFTLRITDPQEYYNQYPGCEQCPGGDGMGAGEGQFGDGQGDDGDYGEFDYTPEGVAALYKTYVSHEWLPALIAIIEDLVAHYGDSAEGEFWSAVLTALME